MSQTARVPVSYADSDSIHLHGGVLYRGESLPSAQEFLDWSRTLRAQVHGYLSGIEAVEEIPVFHLILTEDEPPTFEVRAEVHAFLGERESCCRERGRNR